VRVRAIYYRRERRKKTRRRTNEGGQLAKKFVCLRDFKGVLFVEKKVFKREGISVFEEKNKKK